jgi:hypothetical protein
LLQQLIQNLLAVAALALALPQLIDKPLAAYLIELIPMLQPLKDYIFVQFVTQVIVIMILAIPIWLGVHQWLNKQREGRISEREKQPF